MQLEHLQHELDLANSQLDRNFERLEEAGCGAVELAEKLAIARDRIAILEDELALLTVEKRKSAESLHNGQDLNERLENSLEAVREQMSILKDDMAHERERLQDENRRLRVIISDVQSKSDDEIETLRVEIARAQREVEDQSSDYQERLQTLQGEKDAVDSVSPLLTCMLIDIRSFVPCESLFGRWKRTSTRPELLRLKLRSQKQSSMNKPQTCSACKALSAPCRGP